MTLRYSAKVDAMNIDHILDEAFSAVWGAKAKPLAEPTFDAEEIAIVEKKKAKIKVGSPIWRNRVKFNLISGFGVEDIALKLKCDVEDVRQEMRALRHHGCFAKWWGRNG